MSDFFTRLQDVKRFNLSDRKEPGSSAFRDCPKVLQDAADGKPPVPEMVDIRALVGFGWWIAILLCLPVIWFTWAAFPGLEPAAKMALSLAAWLVLTIGMFASAAWDGRKDYARDKSLFDDFMLRPEVYRDEIFKAAVTKLPDIDFQGRHVPIAEAAIGRYEREMIDAFARLGIRQEISVENRGRPFLIHQYELTELKFGKWPNGDSKNYVLDLAILWPERRIKFDIEIDGPSHKEPAQRGRDVRRDATLTDRGWFVRRLNHSYLSQGYGTAAAAQVVELIYFFAKYANNVPFAFEGKLGAYFQNRRRQKKYRREREEWSKQPQGNFVEGPVS